ncbi:MAG: hypothetical protein NTX97_14730 [Bacteroidetes bacterium]|nr:hypothetical protein [Bacteroidota bacterium]
METTDNNVLDRPSTDSLLEPILFFKRPSNEKATKFTRKLDPLDSRYRKCKYCGTEFMASHRSFVFCENDNFCSNEFHNAIKRDKEAQAIKNELELQARELENAEAEKVVKDLLIEIHQSNLVAIKTANEIAIEFLDKLKIDLFFGTHYKIDTLLQHNFNFEAYTKLEKLHNTPAGHESFCFVFGKYRIYLDDTETVLISKEN